ncbi:hypothetical protein ACN4EE_08620 [Geminocystis sp. CENA526]|uniref:hypothetical protein n=1 Tax=Geminocystis sp. CENA526 TaxID=1355871 RepID=UPI003D6F1228
MLKITPLQQAILLNLYRQQTKKNGRIDLPTIETLVHNFIDSSPINKFPDHSEIYPLNSSNISENKIEDLSPNNYEETTPINSPIINSNQHLELNNQPSAIISENTTNNLINNSIEPPINDVKNTEQDVSLHDQKLHDRETVEMKAEINEVKSSENNLSPSHQIEYNLEKIILELYLQEIAQTLVKPSKKSLKSIFFPNINEFLKEINY